MKQSGYSGTDWATPLTEDLHGWMLKPWGPRRRSAGFVCQSIPSCPVSSCFLTGTNLLNFPQILEYSPFPGKLLDLFWGESSSLMQEDGKTPESALGSWNCKAGWSWLAVYLGQAPINVPQTSNTLLFGSYPVSRTGTDPMRTAFAPFVKHQPYVFQAGVCFWLIPAWMVLDCFLPGWPPWPGSCRAFSVRGLKTYFTLHSVIHKHVGGGLWLLFVSTLPPVLSLCL